MACPFWRWEWSRCDPSARAERAARVTIGSWRTKPARRSARRDGSQREPFHRVEPFHRSVWLCPSFLESAFQALTKSPRPGILRAVTKIIINGSKGRMGQALASCAARIPKIEIIGQVDQGDDLGAIIA